MVRYYPPQEERFWSKVNKTDNCWLWTGKPNKKGYGNLKYNINGIYKDYRAHRISWIIHFGTIPDGLQVCHTCDNPSCVKPKHLFLGTNQQNQLDSVNKGRHASSQKQMCRRGHLYTQETTHMLIRSDGRKERRCKICYAINTSDYRKRKRNAS